MLVGRQEYGDEVKADTILRDIMRGMSVPPTTNSLPTRFTSFPPTAPRLARSLVYIHYYLRTSYTSSRVSLLSSLLTDAQTALLEHDVSTQSAYLSLYRLGSTYIRFIS